MRLAFHYHTPAMQVASGKVLIPGYLGRFLDSIAARCETLICFLHSPEPTQIPLLDYTIESPNLKLVNIGPHNNVLRRTLRVRQYLSALHNHAGDFDILLLRGPSPLLPVFARFSPVPTALLLVGDYLAGVDDLAQPRWRKELIRLWSKWNRSGQD